MTSETPTVQLTCVACSEAIRATELICPWCGAKQATAAPPESAPASAPEPPAAPAPVVRPPVRRHEPEPFVPGDRPSEVTFLVVLLIVSALITLVALFTKNDMLALQPTAFVQNEHNYFSEAKATVAVGGLVLAIFMLVVKTGIGVALWKMLPWARTVAVWTIIGLFCIGSLFKLYVTFTMVSVVQEDIAQRAQERARLTARAFGAGESDWSSTATNAAAGRRPSTTMLPAMAPGTRTPSEIAAPATASRRVTGAVPAPTSGTPSPARGTAVATPPTEGATPDGDATGETDEPTDLDTTSPAAGMDGDAIYDLAQSFGKPDMKPELVNGLMMSFGVLAMLGLLYTLFLLYLLRMEHVQQAYGDT